MSKKDLVDNTRNAFDFLTKLYLEVSYLIKEIQGLLDEEEEKFQIGRTFGYGVTGLRSAGLEVANVNQWLLRKFAVFFVPEVMTEITAGVTETSINGDLKILYMRFVLDAKELAEPTLYAGILYEFERKLIDQNSKKFVLKKFEQLMAPIEQRDSRLFAPGSIFHYEDTHVKFKGKFLSFPLYGLESSKEIVEEVLQPALKMFRETVPSLSM